MDLVTPEGWNKFPLSEIANISMGQSPDSSYYTEFRKGIPFLQGTADFGGTNPSTKVYCIKPTKVCEKYDILISIRAPVGELNLADQKYCIGRGLSSICGKPARIWQPFLFYSLLLERQQLRRLMQGTTFEAVNRLDLDNIQILVPKEIKEQKKIAAILQNVDNSIDKNKEIIEKYKKMKQGLTQNLFARGIDENGIPHIELKDSPLGLIRENGKCMT